MARRQTFRSLEGSVVLSAVASVLAAITMGFWVHEMMWSRVPIEKAEVSKPAEQLPRVRISSGVAVA